MILIIDEVFGTGLWVPFFSALLGFSVAGLCASLLRCAAVIPGVIGGRERRDFLYIYEDER